jgi:hypothetical protein
MIALITPTGGRPEMINLCAIWMRQQEYPGEVLWIIVDDCQPRTTDFITDNFRENWRIIKIFPEPFWQQEQNTQARNLKAGLDIIKNYNAEAIFIIEDDDYYKPCYLDVMMKKLDRFNAAGEINTIFYHVPLKCWLNIKNKRHSSLFQTAFKPVLIPLFEDCFKYEYIDYYFFRIIKNKNLFKAGNISVGIKGQPGRKGISIEHVRNKKYKSDPNGDKLKELLGKDAIHYM